MFLVTRGQRHHGLLFQLRARLALGFRVWASHLYVLATGVFDRINYRAITYLLAYRRLFRRL